MESQDVVTALQVKTNTEQQQNNVSESQYNNDRNPQSESDYPQTDVQDQPYQSSQPLKLSFNQHHNNQNNSQSIIKENKDNQQRKAQNVNYANCSSDSDFSDEYSCSPKRQKGNHLEQQQESVQVVDNTSLYPPPEDLIARSVFAQEPIKTGAPISFVKVDDLKGFEKQTEAMGEQREKIKVDYSEYGGLTKAGSKSLAEDLVKAYSENKVVYSRFGQKYIEKLEKQLNSILNGTGTQVSTSLKTATYLINVKKLIKDHNIDSENFTKLKTKTNVQKSDGPAIQYYQPENDQDTTLIFESRFESGNLLAAIKISETEYDLILQNDINTNGHTQWYFFRVGNTRAQTKIKFNIVNLAKPDSLYNQGMKVLAFSQEQKKENGLGWHRIGTDIGYTQNCYKRENLRFTRYYYTLTFTHEFKHDNDVIYFTHCFPYTYSDLVDDLSRIEKESITQNFFYRNTLGRTLAGNKCEYVTITSKEKDPKSDTSLAKKGVFLSARVHPGESNSSWMMKGIIDFLVSSAPEARVLREKFVFKIVPMLNPDGVINGNYRCSLCGSDLNRRYKAPSKVLHPVIFSVKRLVKAFSKEREIALYCDLHGHSRRKNIFMYGNNYTEKPDVTRMFPFILSKLCDYFSFEYSRFSQHKSKEATARIAMWKELKIPAIYTMEASFSGADKGQLNGQHFTTDTYMQVGRKLLEALLVYCKIDVVSTLNEIKMRKNKKIKCEQEEEEKDFPIIDSKFTQISFESLQKELLENKDLIKMTEGKEEGEGESSASDSDPSEDNLEEEEMAKIVPIKIKKKKSLPEKKKQLLVVPKKKIEEPPIISPNKNDKKNQLKPVQKSPIKRVFNYSNPLYDRLKLRQLKKVEMIDAWTQTSDRGSDNEENLNKRRISASANHKQNVHNLTTSDLKNHLHIIKNSTDPPSSSSSYQQPQLSDQGSFNLNKTQKVMLDSAQSPQPQIRIRKEPFRQQKQQPSNLTKFEERLLKSDKPQSSPREENISYANDDNQLIHNRHYSIENPQPQAQQSHGLSNRNKNVIPISSDNESIITTLQQREKNLTSPKNSYKSQNHRQNLQKNSHKDPRFRQSLISKEDPLISQHRQSIYSSLDKSQAQIQNKNCLPELSDNYLSNHNKLQNQKTSQDLNHQLSGNLTRSGIQQQQKYQLNSSVQNLARNQNLFKLQQQIFKGYNEKVYEQQKPSGKSQERVSMHNTSNNKPLFFTHSDYQQKAYQQQIQLQNVKMRQVLDNNQMPVKTPEKYL